MIGLGLIGGSIALGLRRQGWHLSGDDSDPVTARAALDRGVVDQLGLDAAAEITFVAVPVLAAVDQVKRALAETSGAVTDVGSVKAAICAAAADTRFVGGHPMAGSELDGLDGAQGELFEGAVWVLTPGTDSDDTVFAKVASVVAGLGAEVVALAPERHDQLVAVVSHVPHLTAATLMGLASERADEHAALLRLAAGGFRDMTRVASGRPAIWLDICAENRVAIVEVLDQLIGGLTDVRDIVGAGRPRGPASSPRCCSTGQGQPAGSRGPPRRARRGSDPDPRPGGSRSRDLHAGRGTQRQHRQLRSRPRR